MEAITRLVADSLARHGFDLPVDPRRLQWSRWFRCDTPHSLLVVPSKPGIFALAEEIMDLGPSNTSGASNTHVGTAAPGCPAEQSSATASSATTLGASKDREGRHFTPATSTSREGHYFSSEPALSKRSAPKGAVTPVRNSSALAAGGIADGAQTADVARRMLAVLQFSEDDDMAFTLDRMFTRINPMRARLASGRCFLRFVVIDDQAQRRTICAALNQWILSTAEKATDLSSDFQSSLEFGTAPAPILKPEVIQTAPNLNSGAAKNLHCPHPLPSGF
jgi:hypothetical protein